MTLYSSSFQAPSQPAPTAPAAEQEHPSIQIPVIPEVDPQQDVSGDSWLNGWLDGSGTAGEDGGDHDSYSALVDDGIGFDGDEDEDNDEDDGDYGGVDTPSHKHTTRRPLPPWLKSLFEEKRDEADNLREDGCPLLYRHHRTFWFPQPSTFFLLKDRNCRPLDLYNPRFFLWDPMPLCQPFGIPCPNCRTPLRRNGSIPRPRRCVGTDSVFWMIGYRYRCSKCRHPVSQKQNSVSFRSWDDCILSVLPRSLSLEFPAVLSHRSGLAKETLGIVRSCFQNGMGPKQVSDALRVQHLKRHDTLHLQYLHSLVTRTTAANFLKQSFEPFLPFNDDSDTGFNGFVPSAQWLRDTYDGFIESHQHELNQHMALLSGEICAIDHSHKVSL